MSPTLMKPAREWQLGMGDILIMSRSTRQRSQLQRPTWIVAVVSLVTIFFILAHVYRQGSSCYIFSSGGCFLLGPHDLVPYRELTDEETIARVVMKEILKTPPIQPKKPKIAFMFLTPGSLPFERLWEKFFQGHEDRFSIYVHSSRERPVHVSSYFHGRDIRSHKVEWGKVSMLDAEKRLLAYALYDPNNQQFVLLSDSCVPLHNFDYVYNYLVFTNISHIDCFEDPGPHGSGRYSEHMLPEVQKDEFRKGSQKQVEPAKIFGRPNVCQYHVRDCNITDLTWFAMKRQHALIVMADSLYYSKFKLYCKPNMDGRNCYADEHYLPTLFNMIDPGGIANWSVTHVDWSEGKWHPKAYRNMDVTYELIKNITSIDETIHVTSDSQKTVTTRSCMWNRIRRPCYLFARKFYPETLDRLLFLFSNYTTI